MKKIFVIVPLLLFVLVFGCFGPDTNTYCGDAELHSFLPDITDSGVYLNDSSQYAWNCNPDTIKAQIQGIDKVISVKYNFSDPNGICTNGDFCSNIVNIMKFENRENLNTAVEFMKSNSQHNENNFYTVNYGTSKLYYNDDGDVRNLYYIAWSSNEYLITMTLNNTPIVASNVRDHLLTQLPSDIK